MATYTQDNIYLSVSTPLGKDTLLLRAFHGEERLSDLFQYSLEMVSTKRDISFDGMVGKSATIAIQTSAGSTCYINGIVGRFYQGGADAQFTAYYAELRPWLWLLTLSSDSRIFQQQTTPQIVEAVFKDLGFSDYRLSLTKSYDPREYCVQYQETAFNFVSRLLEDEGIFYFFEHQDGKHTLVLADCADTHTGCPGLSGPVRYTSSLAGSTPNDAVTRCTLEQQVITGAHSLGDFNFETPTNALSGAASGANGSLSVYEYPGGFTKSDAGNTRARLRLETHEAPRTLLRGEGFSPAFAAGYSFTLQGHDRADANMQYVLQRVVRSATDGHYAANFEAFPASAPFRPPRLARKPAIPGPQTAIVVGKSGEEIWTDQYGRVKVQFHWDRKGRNDEQSSCWIRVMQGWAGKAWGSIFIPRIGQEVVVSFLEGDPDRPLITGGVYNAQQTVPYALPDAATRSTIKSNSTKGGGGSNEIRFEDKKDSEELYVHAQKDMNISVEHDRAATVLNDDTSTVKQNRSATIQQGNESLTVQKGNRTIQVSQGDETHSVKGKRDLTVTGNETHSNEADFSQTVSGSYTLKVTGDLTIDVTGSVTIKSAQSLTTQAGSDITNQAGASLTNSAGSSLTSQSGGTQTLQASGILSLQGSMVQINS